mgnify:CR=1 FL=1
MNNVSIEDVKNIESYYGLLLSNEQRKKVLDKYNRMVMDSAEDWEGLLKRIIVIEIVRPDDILYDNLMLR